MTPQEHAERVLRRLKRVERNFPDSRCVASLHEALADALKEHGESIGIGGNAMQVARATKDEPENPPEPPVNP